MSKEKELIAKFDRMKALIKELERSKQAEKCNYHLVRLDPHFKLFGLVSLKTKKIVSDGTPTRIKSYMRLRAIESCKVLDFELIHQ